MAVDGEDVDGDECAGYARQAYGADAGADDGWCVAGVERGAAESWGEVEGRDVEDCEEGGAEEGGLFGYDWGG